MLLHPRMGCGIRTSPARSVTSKWFFVLQYIAACKKITRGSPRLAAAQLASPGDDTRNLMEAPVGVGAGVARHVWLRAGPDRLPAGAGGPLMLALLLVLAVLLSRGLCRVRHRHVAALDPSLCDPPGLMESECHQSLLPPQLPAAARRRLVTLCEAHDFSAAQAHRIVSRPGHHTGALPARLTTGYASHCSAGTLTAACFVAPGTPNRQGHPPVLQGVPPTEQLRAASDWCIVHLA